MIDPQTAVNLVLAHVTPGDLERVPLAGSLGRYLAESIACDVDYPPFDRAMMDGYAVRAEDVAKPGATLAVVGQVAAGSTSPIPLRPAQAIQINTGAPLPTGADSVVPIEDVAVDERRSQVTIRAPVRAGQHIARRGTCVTGGQCVLETGMRMGPGEIGVAAAAGAAQVSVFQQPSVALLITGDELVDVDQTPAGAQLRNSNGYILDALVRRSGGRPHHLGVVRDDVESLTARIQEGLTHDILCVTGGISMGEFDFVPEVLERCGCTMRFQKVAIKPGKPTLFATGPTGSLVFGLSGNPLSSVIGFLLFVQPALRARQGGGFGPPLRLSAKLSGRIGASGGRQSYWPARLCNDANGGLMAHAIPWHGSGDPFGMASANAMIVRPSDATAVTEGTPVEVLLWEDF